MAHFVEHLLFMGNKKYPQEADFSRFIGDRGGYYNAFTSHDRTVYGFSINHEGFEGALDRLSCFFKYPNFSQDTISREMNAVHHEFEDEIENEGLRLWRIIKETGSEIILTLFFPVGIYNLWDLLHQPMLEAGSIAVQAVCYAAGCLISLLYT
jgi:hypothetical protein